MTRAKQRIRADILKRRGLVAKKYGQVEPVVLPPIRTPLAGARNGKTLAMRLIEGELNMPIEEVLSTGTLGEVSEMLGVDKSTISKWRLKLGLREERGMDD